MARQTVAYRLVSEGKATLINDFKEIGDSGNASAQRIGRAFERDAASAEAAIRKLEGTAAKLQSLQGPTVQDRINASTGISSGPSRDASASARALFAEEDRLLAKRAALLAQIDPLFAAQQRYNAVMSEATTLRQRGIMTEQEFVRVQSVAKESLEQMTLAQDRMAATNGLARAGWQQTGFQLQDIAIQYSMGTSAATIFAMQSGQVVQALSMVGQGSGVTQGKLGSLLNFLGGPWGIGLGVAASVVGLVAVKLFDTEEAGEAAKKGYQAAASGADTLSTALQRLEGFQYRELAGRSAFDAIARVDEEIGSVRTKISGMRDSIERDEGTRRGAQREAARLEKIAELEGQLVELQRQRAVGATELNRLSKEDTDKRQAEAERELEKAKREADRAGRSSARELRELTREQEEYARSLLALEGKYDPAAAAAKRFKEELAEIDRLESKGVIDRDRASDFAMQARAGAFMPGLMDDLAPDRKVEEDRTKDEERRREYAERIKQDMADQQSYLAAELVLVRASDDTRAATLSKLRLIQDLNREGIKLGSEDAQEILRANDALEEKTRILLEQQRAWEETKRFGEDMIDTVLNPQNWEDFGDLGKSVLRELQAEFIKLAMLNPIKNMLFGGDRTTLGDVLGGLGGLFGSGGGGFANDPLVTVADVRAGGLSIDIPAFATGTEYASGGMAWLAENGPELVSLPRGSRVTPAAETRRLLSNGEGVSVPISISIDATGADAAGLARVQAELAALRRDLPGQVVGIVHDARSRRILVN